MRRHFILAKLPGAKTCVGQIKHLIRLHERQVSVIRIIPLLVLLFLAFQSLPALSHYLWTTVENDSGKYRDHKFIF